LRYDDDVAVLELHCVGDEGTEVIPFGDLRQSFDREYPHLRQLPAPPRRAPADSGRLA
jgi:hypothetical protein